MAFGSKMVFAFAVAVFEASDADGQPAVTAGRDLSVQICAACHDVGAPQPFAPVLQPPAPPFRTIANRPGTAAESLRKFVMNPHGDQRPVSVRMPNQLLLPEQADDVVAYIMSLRQPPRGAAPDKPAD
jgi:mono/diheme cytochrome c family protein